MTQAHADFIYRDSSDAFFLAAEKTCAKLALRSEDYYDRMIAYMAGGEL